MTVILRTLRRHGGVESRITIDWSQKLNISKQRRYRRASGGSLKVGRTQLVRLVDGPHPGRGGPCPLWLTVFVKIYVGLAFYVPELITANFLKLSDLASNPYVGTHMIL